MGYAEELAKLQAEQAKRNAAIEENNRQLEAQLQANSDALKAAQQQNEADMLAAQQRQQKDFADIALQYKADYDAAQAEDEALRQQEQKRAVWVGVTEALANLNNLIGVGSFDSSNQQYHSYSKDWMDHADAERRLRRNRLDNIRDRQRAMAQQLAQLRGNQAQQFIALRGQNAGQRYNADMHTAATIAGAKDKLAAQKANDAAQLANITIAQGNADRQFEEQKRARQAQEGARQAQLEETQRYHDATIAANMAKQGYSPDGKGGWKYTGKPGGGGGSGSGSTIKLTLKEYGNEPNETIEIKPGSLVSVNANIEHITDISDKDKKKIQMILASTGSEDDKAKKLVKYAVESPELRKILRQSGVGNMNYGDITDMDFPEAGGDEDESGFPTPGGN